MSESKPITIGAIEPFAPGPEMKEEQPAVRVLEESAQLLEAYRDWDEGGETEYLRLRLFDKSADVIQATVNLLASMGALDYEVNAAIKRCRERNRAKDRY
ncbi:hypothetical protein [Bifidobacterium platyrrhinorum]|uniref:Nucleotide pyrophosphohydrolase n=1 Tax=Bifidobacterium platyrrhinorum TaxID=2661628 RepID=A0A6L9SRT7_9BIFI|nr:hypothetical protein [Bifidobacterium platyrrhinorum]NEG54483.1 hypothetical protein [Bifidobacterium platyrrhinorum]